MRSTRHYIKVYHAIIFIFVVSAILATLRYGQYIINARSEATSNVHACQSNINNIAIALRNYSASFGCLPAPFSANEEGRRIQSWRVSLLPWFSFDHDAAAGYNYGEPWDSVANKRLLSNVPAFYKCPAYRDTFPPHASYFMVNDLSNLDVTKVPKDAILVIEVNNTDICWTCPFDDTINPLRLAFDPAKHPGGFNVILGDFTRLLVLNPGKICKSNNIYVLCK
jgi:hypothetical protein